MQLCKVADVGELPPTASSGLRLASLSISTTKVNLRIKCHHYPSIVSVRELGRVRLSFHREFPPNITITPDLQRCFTPAGTPRSIISGKFHRRPATLASPPSVYKTTTMSLQDLFPSSPQSSFPTRIIGSLTSTSCHDVF